MSKSLRDQMPLITAFIDDYRDAFGKDFIDESIRDGLKGKPTFHATENGHEIGTRGNFAPGVPMSETLVGPMALKKRGAGK